uniref:Thiolase_N domain-containing protein n=1 Tax=Toxocara canis TaxID=6265 RepID=A0A183U7M1_TOXCA
LIAAQDSGVFKKEITPITIKSKKGDTIFEVDEHPRLTTIEKLLKLPPVFQKRGLIDAGNASVCLLKRVDFHLISSLLRILYV